MLRTRGSRHLHEERAVARTTLYSSGAREAEAGAGTSSSLLNGLAYQTAWGLLASIPSVLQTASSPSSVRKKSDVGRVRAAAQQHSSLFYSHVSV